MADICEIYTVAGMTMNAATGDTLVIEEIDGLDGIDTRRTIWPQGAGDGAILGTSRKRERLPVFTGFQVIRTVPNPYTQPAAFRAAIKALEDAWVAAIDGIANASSNLAWASDTLAVKKHGPGIKFSKGPNGIIGKRFILSLIAADPTIT